MADISPQCFRHRVLFSYICTSLFSDIINCMTHHTHPTIQGDNHGDHFLIALFFKLQHLGDNDRWRGSRTAINFAVYRLDYTSNAWQVLLYNYLSWGISSHVSHFLKRVGLIHFPSFSLFLVATEKMMDATQSRPRNMQIQKLNISLVYVYYIESMHGVWNNILAMSHMT